MGSKGGGGGGGGGGSATSTSTSLPPSYLTPYIGEYLNLLQEQTTGQGPTTPWQQKWGTPSTVAYPGPNLQVAQLNPTEQAALTGMTGAGGAQTGLANQAAMTSSGILAGQNLGPQTNPFLNQYYNAAAQGLTNQYQAATAPSNMAQAALSGAFGGSADAENRALSNYGFGNQLQNLAANIYEPAYQQGLQQQTQTLGLTPETTANLGTGAQTQFQAGGIGQEQQQSNLNAQYQNQYTQAMWPYMLSQLLGGGLQAGTTGLGARQAGTTSESSAGGGGIGSDILGGAETGLGLMGLDPNFLSNIGSGLGSLGSTLGSGFSSIASLLPFLGA